MNCEECSGLLIDYLEDTLGSEEAGVVKEHLSGCPECALELEHYREIRTVARGEALPEASPQVLSSLSEAARKSSSREKTPFWKKWSYSPILVPTISAVIALSVWFYYGQDGIDGIDSVTREVAAVKMRAPETRQEAFSDAEEEQKTLALETGELKEQEKPPAESRISPAPPADPETSRDVPSKGMLQKKDITEEDLVTYRESRTSSNVGTESHLKATQPILKDYAGELELARRQQARGDCEASIKTNEALLKSSPPPPRDLQAGSYKSLAECYEKIGELNKAVASYKSLGRVDPAQASFANEKVEEIKINAAYMNYDIPDSATEPAN